METQETKIKLSEDFFNEKTGRWEGREVAVAPTQKFWLQYPFSEQGASLTLHKLWICWLKEQNNLEFLEEGEFEEKLENSEELEFFETFEEFCGGKGLSKALEETNLFVNNSPEEEEAKERRYHGEEEEEEE